MGSYSSFDVTASGLTAQRLRMDVISNNLANINTTRTPQGGPYKRQQVVFETRLKDTVAQQGGVIREIESGEIESVGQGVRVAAIVEDQTPPILVYNPSHPDADANGYVKMPNVNSMYEMVDMMSATRAYEANVAAFNASKSMANKALEIGR